VAPVYQSRNHQSVEGRPADDRIDDGELVERARRGDVEAYEQLVQRYQGLASRVAYLVARDAADAEDAAQEAFVKAFYALDRFRKGAAFKPWLLRIVTNEALNRRRSAGRRAGLALRAAEEPVSGDAAPSPETAALELEKRRTLLAALESLAEPDRLVVTYRYFLDLSEAEMAAALGVPRGTVKSRLSRALVKLRAAMPAEVANE
jgi:RNA polymerase sigma factor (sigma-70 family)